MILFLDFDGTLHPLWTFDRTGTDAAVTAALYAGPWLIEAPTLERILQPYLNRIEIVLSTAWAHTRGLQVARGMLPAAVAERVSESIWLPELEMDYRSSRCTRYGCIQMWLERRRPSYTGLWLALDDDDYMWPQAERHRLVHASGTLADPDARRGLAEKLERHFSADR